MNRRKNLTGHWSGRIPHLCGDEPDAEKGSILVKEYSPLVWG